MFFHPHKHIAGLGTPEKLTKPTAWTRLETQLARWTVVQQIIDARPGPEPLAPETPKKRNTGQI